MRTKVYNALVNKRIGISERYHIAHDGTTGIRKMFSWVYLLWLNFAYYVLFCKFLGKAKKAQIYEKKRLLTNISESSNYKKNNPNMSVDKYLETLLSQDIVSFDVFDTLIFRKVESPKDLFHFIGEKLGIADFANKRAWAEHDARLRKMSKQGHYEVTFEEIWDRLYEDLGESANGGLEAEYELEKSFCYANPFMLKVWNQLINAGKNVIVISDMYLGEKRIKEILEMNGFTGAKKIYVSCDYKKNKAKGDLYEYVREEIKQGKIADLNIEKTEPLKWTHVGDNMKSDINVAKKHHINTIHYNNINRNSLLYRAHDMSKLVGSTYRAIVNEHIYNGLSPYSIDYEYGFIYGGLFVTGYCNYINKYVKQNEFDKILFLSRDGDTLKKAYDQMFPDGNTEYVYWSRKAATKLMASYDKNDYFRRFIYHKTNQEYTLAEIFKSMEIEPLLQELSDWKQIYEEYELMLRSDKCDADNKELVKWKKAVKKNYKELTSNTRLTDKNAYFVRRFIEAKWDKVTAIYDLQLNAAKKYYEKVLLNSKKILVVDIGWAGSGALSLSYLVEKVWKLPCELVGMVAGTNTLYNSEPDASEVFLQSDKLVSYMYSQNSNRDLYKKHNPNKDYNVYWELLLSSPTPGFNGFYEGDLTKDNADNQYIDNMDITLSFGKYDDNLEGIKDIQTGILDFVNKYYERFKTYPYMFNISGRDAYAPMIVASSYNEKYLKMIKKRYDFEINVN